MTALDDAAWGSPWRARPVADKALLAVGLVVIALVSDPWPGCAVAGLVAIVALLGPAGISARVLVTAMTPPIVFTTIGALSVAVTMTSGLASGSGGGSLGPWGVTADSLAQAASVSAHGVAGALGVMVLALTTPMVDIVAGLRRWRVPSACLDAAALTYRLVFVLLRTCLVVLEARRSRLADTPGGQPAGLRARVVAAGQVSGVVAARAWEQAHRLAEGLRGRGDEGALHTLPSMQRASYRFVAVVVLVLISVAAIALGTPRGWGVRGIG